MEKHSVLSQISQDEEKLVLLAQREEMFSL